MQQSHYIQKSPVRRPSIDQVEQLTDDRQSGDHRKSPYKKRPVDLRNHRDGGKQ